MQNMRAIMPALQKAQPVAVGAEGITFSGVERPTQRRDTRVVKDQPVEATAQEIVDWIKEG
jgi:electron transfer flavoprotein beta subunit